MRAVVLDDVGDSSTLRPRMLPVPEPPRGWVRVQVRAAGVQGSDLYPLRERADGGRVPFVPGIEAVGVVETSASERFGAGEQVAVVLGGTRRTFGGGYAQYMVVPDSAVTAFRSGLPWSVLGAVPETLQTAYGSLSVGIGLQAGQSLLIRGGTSALGYVATALAVDRGATVLATTRRADRLGDLARRGVHVPLVDNGKVAEQVRSMMPDGVDAALELVGTGTLRDTLDATRMQGTVCITRMLSGQRAVEDFRPVDYLPRGVRLTAYNGAAPDLPAAVLQRHLDMIADGRIDRGPVMTYPLDQASRAHDDIEHGRVFGKAVLIVDHDPDRVTARTESSSYDRTACEGDGR
ncbi:zinc-binding dehydrogenase [Tsukamurella tyrosinosolvens]|uniref:zinc-binding dehydrogenase n=1 Tax=Tsukamurella tyrosinosolvens TaxID=57704 RepID=UPI003678388F